MQNQWYHIGKDYSTVEEANITKELLESINKEFVYKIVQVKEVLTDL